MNRTALGGAALALIAVFVAIAVSVVDARRPLDASVEKSFDAVASQVRLRAATVASLGCTKTRVDFYACTATLRRRYQPAAITVVYSLMLTDDGCWKATATPRALLAVPARLKPRLTRLRGCRPGASPSG